jgi:hypothetical protein
MPFKNIRFFHSIFIIIVLIGLKFHYCFCQYSHKTWCYPLLQILVTHFSASSIPRKCTSAAWERTVHLVCSSCKCNLEHAQTRLVTGVYLTRHHSNKLRPSQELNCRTMNNNNLCKALSECNDIKKLFNIIPSTMWRNLQSFDVHSSHPCLNDHKWHLPRNSNDSNTDPCNKQLLLIKWKIFTNEKGFCFNRMATSETSKWRVHIST